MLLWAVLQFALPSAASYADALLERSSTRALGAHVEAHATKSCASVHPTDCALCQLVQRLDPAPTPVVPFRLVVRMAVPGESLEFVIFGTPAMAVGDERFTPRKPGE